MTKRPVDDYLWDRSGEDKDVARLEALLSPLQHDAPLDELRLHRAKSRWPMVAGAAMAVAAMMAVIAWWQWPRTTHGSISCTAGVGFAFTAKGGDVACNGTALPGGVLPTGGTLDTGANQAELAIADIGHAQLGAHTIVRLDHTAIGKRHQLFLQEGRMHARVTAPPKIFAVATPSADVIDLGCEYTLEIDRNGAGSIHVLTGQVELETGNGAVMLAPAGTHGRLLPGRRASWPVSDRANPAFSAAVAQLEAGAPDGIGLVLAAATKVDAITIANLARSAPGAEKRRVLERLATLVAAPQCTTIDEALADKDLFDMWFEEVYLVHIGASDGVAKSCPPP